MRNQKLCILCFALCLMAFGGQMGHAQSGNLAFGHGETLNYLVSYHWGFLWLDAGEVQFSANRQKDDAAQGWIFRSTGNSMRHWDWLFRVRDTFEVRTAINPFEPLVFYRHTHEGRHQTLNNVRFDWLKRKARFIASETGKADTDTLISLSGNVTDVLTATYITRSLNFGSMKPNQGFNLKILMDKGVVTLPIRYLGKETITTPSGLSFNCIGFYTTLEESSLFETDEKIKVWITDDANKIPVLIEAKIKIGMVKVYLHSFENLAHPLDSFIPIKKNETLNAVEG